ncbi:hypothetical protein FVEG_13347 [Fusarium verticillioides 7600]|uniref:Uncharacterized protein n=1 Tax=Gibberella moniliformis (strain M3125 / FGSC 7600) TaxID=334819 RepID=W7N6K8_GIBM7|nr:hypothetical protein FVEG_13347 [Fusarium verticillioides 7600]EWG55334.1 hypothetical protein FVEG_13347 [Fusarium verticillioides 7600]
MPSQEELAENPLMGNIQVPDEGDGDGKTYNVDDEDQRSVVTSWKDTSFTRYVQLETCVHGIWSEDDPTPTTLLVFRCEFVCIKDDHRLKSIAIRWKFVNTDVGEDGKVSSPNIVARGPYMREWNELEAEEEEGNEIGGDLGGEGAGAKAAINLKRTHKSTYKQQYFEKVVSWHDYNNDERRREAVYWRFTQNHKKDSGVTPVFRTAILIRRQNNAKFDGIFEITEFDGGWKYNLSQAWKDFTGVPKNVDDPVHFNPEATDILPSFEDKAVNKQSLGRIATMEGIDKEYAWIWGLDVGKG